MIPLSDAKLAWALVPKECKASLRRLKETGLMLRARPEILAEAEAGLKLMGRHTAIDVCVALELAAEHWIADHPEEMKA